MKTSYNALHKMKVIILLLFVFSFFYVKAQTLSTFEELNLAPNSYWDGSDGSGGFANGDAYFYNDYNAAFGSGTGFSYSNTTDNTTGGAVNQFSAYAGEGAMGSENYTIAIVYGPVGIKLTGQAEGKTVNGFFVTNTTYAGISMKNGDSFGKKFGGASGNDPDWFKLTITGYLNETAKSSAVDFYLSDFRNANNAFDYILDTWKWVDLTSLGNVDSLAFTLSSSDEGLWGMNTPAYFALDNFNDPLYSPQVGQPGSTAMHKDSSAFMGWASACTVARGPQDISNPSLGNATVGDPSMAIGQPGSGIVSLGDGGTATLTFSIPIGNGTGPDFAIFENAFAVTGGAFLELAYVEVSSDGTNFFRFPSVSLTDESVQKGNADGLEAKKINNLAGKYLSSYGTPFDLEELKDEVGLDIHQVTHVRIIDVVGSIDPLYARYDSYGNKINDPWPTAFASSGFDLDAVGIINPGRLSSIAGGYDDNRLTIFPNPSDAEEEITIAVNFTIQSVINVQVFDYAGQLVKETETKDAEVKISANSLLPGVYVVKLSDEDKVVTKKLVIN